MSKALESLIKNIKRGLTDLNWSQAKLSKESGVPQPHISAYLAKKVKPGFETIEAIAEAMGVSVADLVGDEKPAFRAPPKDPLEDFKREALISLLRAKPEQWTALRPALVAVFPRLGESLEERKQSG